MCSDNSISLLVIDIEREYVKYRESGKTRAQAIELLRDEYDQELQDDEERIAVLIGLSLSLCKKKELYESIATETIHEIQLSVEEGKMYGISETYISDIVRRLNDPEVYGAEAVYKEKVLYVPNWKIGDTFSHVLTCPHSEKLGIRGWLVLLHKVGEYVDRFEITHQLMNVSICPPEQLPSCSQELQDLGFLPVMCIGGRKEFLAQMTIKSRRGENAFKLTKVGHFPNIELPDDPAIENPLTAMPLFGFIRKGENWPLYEDQVCGFYRDYRKNT